MPFKFNPLVASLDLVNDAAGGTVTNNYINAIQVDQSGGTTDTHGVLTGAINGSNTTFTVSSGQYQTGSLSVYLNGQLLTQGSSEDWTETTPASGTFDLATAPLSGDQITAVYIEATVDNNTYVKTAGDTMTGELVLAAGTTTEPPLTMTDGTLLTTPEDGALEFSDSRLYVTSLGKRRALDRTNDIITSTTTVSNTTTETTLFTGAVDAGDFRAGNIFKIFTSGVISNNSASDDITINVYIGSTLIETYIPAIGNVTGADWHTSTQLVVRSVGASGSIAVHGEVHIDGNTSYDNSIETIDTTVSEDITVTAQWDNAKAGNTISIYQGHMEIKN